jgi:hypothetical protein
MCCMIASSACHMQRALLHAAAFIVAACTHTQRKQNLSLLCIQMKQHKRTTGTILLSGHKHSRAAAVALCITGITHVPALKLLTPACRSAMMCLSVRTAVLLIELVPKLWMLRGMTSCSLLRLLLRYAPSLLGGRAANATQKQQQ